MPCDGAIMFRAPMTKKFLAAFRAHERSKRDLQKAASDIERFTGCLFGALKFQEKAVAHYHETAKRLKRAQR